MTAEQVPVMLHEEEGVENAPSFICDEVKECTVKREKFLKIALTVLALLLILCHFKNDLTGIAVPVTSAQFGDVQNIPLNGTGTIAVDHNGRIVVTDGKQVYGGDEDRF